MVNGVNGNSKLGVLLQQKQKKLESINQQKQVVENEFKELKSTALSSKVKVENKEMSLSEAIVALQNHPFKGMKEPSSNAPQYEIKDTEGNVTGYNSAQFDKDMAEFKKAEAEYKNLEKGIDEQTKELEITKDDLNDMMAKVSAKEEELKSTDAEYDVTMGDIESLNKQIDEASQTEQIDITLSKDKNNDTLVEATVNQLKALQEQGLVDKNIKLDDLKPEQLKKLSEAVVNQDIKNGTVAEGTSTDGTSADYTKLKAGDGRKYTVAQMQEFAKSLSTETDSSVSYDIVDDADPLPSLPGGNEVASTDAKPEATTTKPDAKTDKSEIKFPRGIEWQNTKGDSLSSFGIKDNGDGTYTSSMGKIHTADEVNEWFRQIENSVDSNYSKYLDKAEELGIDYTKYSSPKDLKAAVKAKEKENKAIEKAEKKAEKAQAKVDKAEQKAEVAQAKADTAKANVETLKANAKTSGTTSTTSRTLKSLKDGEKDEEFAAKNRQMQAAEEVAMGYSTTADGKLSKTSETKSSKSDLSAEDILNGKGFDAFNAKIKAKILSSFKDGAKGSYNINGTTFNATQKVSKTGQKAYLVNGQYYDLRSDGMPDLSKPLKKADFE